MSPDPYVDDDDEYRSSSSPQSPTMYKSDHHVSSPLYQQSPRSSYPVANEHANYSSSYLTNGSNTADSYIPGYVYPSASKHGSSRPPESKTYVPLTSEDRRALGAFRVAL